MVNAALIITLGSDPTAVLAKIAKAHDNLGVVNVAVSAPTAKASPLYVSLKGSSARMLLPDERLVEVSSSGMRFFDTLFNQYVNMPLKTKGDPARNLISVAFVHREPLGFLLDPQIRRNFLSDLAIEKSWKIGKNQLSYKNGQKAIESVVDFDAKYRITRIKTTLATRPIVDWKFSYGIPAVATIPASAIARQGLPERPSFPIGTQSDAILMAKRCWRAMSGIRQATFVQDLDGKKFELKVSPSTLSETSSTGSWTATSKGFVIQPKNGAKKTIKGKPALYRSALQTAKMPLSPMGRYYFNRTIPTLDFYNGAQKVEVEGRMLFEGKQCTILSIKKGLSHIRLYLGTEDGKISMISSDSRDSSGKVFSGSRLKVSYRP